MMCSVPVSCNNNAKSPAYLSWGGNWIVCLRLIMRFWNRSFCHRCGRFLPVLIFVRFSRYGCLVLYVCRAQIWLICVIIIYQLLCCILIQPAYKRGRQLLQSPIHKVSDSQRMCVRSNRRPRNRCSPSQGGDRVWDRFRKSFQPWCWLYCYV